MGLSLYSESELARRLFDEANDILGWDLKGACFEGPEALLTETRVCQPALYIHGYALFAILKEAGKLPDLKAALGLSLGELTALAAAEVYDFATGLKVVAERGRLMQEACESTRGGMASLIGGEASKAEELAAKHDVDMGNLNCPGQIVLSGDKDRIEAVVADAKDAGFKMAVPLKVAGAYHSRLMQSAADQFAVFLQDIEFAEPKLTVFTNVTGQQIRDPQAIKDALVKQVTSPVKWEDCMRGAIGLSIDTFYECGPGGVLAGLAKRIDRSARVTPLSEYQELPL